MTSSVSSSSSRTPEGDDPQGETDESPAPRELSRELPPALPTALSDALTHASVRTMRELATAAQSAHHDADLRDSIVWVTDAVRAVAVDSRAEPRTHPPAPAPLALDALRASLLSELGAMGERVDGSEILRLLGAVER